MTVRLGNAVLAGTPEFKNYTTNRILEIPQDIKLELNNGTLTLKAGSKVYVPNGTGVFNEIVFSSDITVSSQPNDTRLYCFKSDGSYLRLPSELIFSGSTAPTSIGQYGAWYDTTNNLVKYTTNSGSTWTSGYSLPAFIATGNGSSVTSIDQVFNGFGYIGSTVFVLPNVKVQIPNGRNEDGAFNSIIRTLDTVKIIKNDGYTGTYSNVGAFITLDDTANTLALCDNKEYGYRYFDDARNCWVYYNDNSDRISINIAYLSLTNGKITSFTPCNVDSVANSNMSNISSAGRSFISGMGMPSTKYIDLTLGASGATYTAPANGWFCFYSGAVCDSRFQSHSGYFGNTVLGKTGFANNNKIEALKGDSVKLNYSSATDSHLFFFYAQGEI